MPSRPVNRGLRGGTFHTSGSAPANPGLSVDTGPALGNGGVLVGRPPASRRRNRSAAAASSKPVRSTWISGAYSGGGGARSTSTRPVPPPAPAVLANAARAPPPPDAETKTGPVAPAPP